ncbi:DUF3000 domain-containing protein [Arthrobacter sp. Sa2CUA1]|uniref:DUF3000 domain-containing protein n=1 Tax=Arthrobacter gallicola TaxID=2762225 RepID=A0ABR8UMT9_9MICC|nr:DUF3000 domain-containing protein [Arthrobacter gallicola]MBD7993864.1 DUF3000 domain-containing protein [Arthrobacter gallicola]
MGDLSQVPPEFLTALGALRRAKCRPELRLEEIPAPTRLAPFAVSLAADVVCSGPQPTDGTFHGPVGQVLPQAQELATGRFILLYDPEGSDVWNGNFRIVTYIRAELEPDMGNDQMLGSVAWAWLVDALQEHGARYSSAGGTATRILSESYGTLAGRSDAIDIELRASWTPDGADVQSHLEAWSDMVCTFAGLPPLPDGVSPLPRRRLN